MPALEGQIFVDENYTDSNWERIIYSLSIKKERYHLSEELKNITRNPSEPVLANKNALDSIYKTYITLNDLVKDIDKRIAKEKAAELNEKVQELVFSSLRAWTSEDAQRSLSKTLLFKSDAIHPLLTLKKLPVNLCNISESLLSIYQDPTPENAQVVCAQA